LVPVLIVLIDASGVFTAVLPILVAMLGIVVLACLVVIYVAYPHRGQEVPHAPWVGRIMRRGVNQLPTLDNRSDQQKYDSAGRH